MSCPGALHSSVRSLSLEVNASNSIIETFYHASTPSLATLNWLVTWYLPLSDITKTPNRCIGSTLRCTPGTGGGLYRCVSSVSDPFTCSYVVPDFTQIALSWRHSHPTDSFFRQNAAHSLWRENGIPCLYDNWKYTKRHLLKAFTAYSDIDCIHSHRQTGVYRHQGCSSPCRCESIPFMFTTCLRSDRTLW